MTTYSNKLTENAIQLAKEMEQNKQIAQGRFIKLTQINVVQPRIRTSPVSTTNHNNELFEDLDFILLSDMLLPNFTSNIDSILNNENELTAIDIDDPSTSFATIPISSNRNCRIYRK